MGIRDFWRDLPDQTTPLKASTLNEWGALVDDRVLDAEAARDAARAAAEDAQAPGDDAVAAYVADPASATRTQVQALAAPPSLTGTYAARPSASSVRAGTIYYPTNVPEQYRSTGTAWTVIGSGGNELGHAQITTSGTAQGPTAADVPGLTVTFVAGERPVEVEVDAQFIVATMGIYATAQLMLGTTGIGSVQTVTTIASQQINLRRCVRLSTLTAGSTYTVKVQAGVFSGTITPQGSATNPSALWVRTR